MTYREAIAFFLRNLDLLEDFILKYLTTKQKLRLLEVLQQEFAKDRSFSQDERIVCIEKSKSSTSSQLRQSGGRSTRISSRLLESKDPSLRSLGDGITDEVPANATKYRLQDFQSMGIFFNPDNLPQQIQASLTPQRRTVRRTVQKALLPAMKRLSILSDRSLGITDSEREETDNPIRKKSRVSLKIEGQTSTHKDDKMSDTFSKTMFDFEALPPEMDEINEEEWERIIFQAHLRGDSDAPRQTVFHLHESVSRPFSVPAIAHTLITAITSDKFTRNEIVQSLVNNLLIHVPATAVHLHLRDGQNIVLFKSHEPRKSFYVIPPDLQSNQTTPTLQSLHTGEILVANNVREDDRFSADHMKIDPSIEHVVDYPLYSLDGIVAAIVEVQRNAAAGTFDDTDVKMILAFAYEAQMALLLREKMLREAKQATHHIFIKKIVGILFSQIRNVDNVIKTTMVYAKILTKASRATLFLLDNKKQELVSSIFDMGDLNKPKFMSVNQIRISVEKGIAGYVARTGNPLITNNPESNEHFYEAVDRESGYKTKNIIAVPIKVDGHVEGVMQVLNKTNGIFNDEDLEAVLDFSVFCGIALHISKIHEKMYRAEQKCRVTMEIMLHHNIASDQEVQAYATAHPVPERVVGINNPLFSPWHMPDDDQPACFIYMARELVGKEMIDETAMIRFALTVRKNYRNVTYHNWFHAFSVAHATFVTVNREDAKFSKLEKFCLLVASLCHDLDHRGRDNSYLRKNHTPLASLYTSSPLEHHHFNMAVTILQQPGNQIFAAFHDAVYLEILMIIKFAILSTDLSNFAKAKARLENALDQPGGIDWSKSDDRLAVIGLLFPSSDLCAMYKPWPVHLKVVLIVMEEFWSQGDEEKQQGLKPVQLMDRDLSHLLPDDQVGFYKAICLPCFEVVVRAIPTQRPMLEQALKNMAKWSELAALPLKEKKEAVSEILRHRPSAASQNSSTVSL